MRIRGMKFAYTIAITLVNVSRAQQVSMNVRTRFLCSGYQTCTPRRLLRYVLNPVSFEIRILMHIDFFI